VTGLGESDGKRIVASALRYTEFWEVNLPP